MNNLSWIDWAIMIVAVVLLRYVSLSTRLHMKGVADFLSANRSAGRYLLTIAGQMGHTGAITIVALFEMYYGSGFSPIWWALMALPVGVIIALTGWVFYRFRETRALTMAQFLEMRYSRRFRIFAGILCFTSGILNFGIFPAVAARFIIYYCGLPDFFHIPGIPHIINLPFDLPLLGSQIHLFNTFAVVMLIDLGLALTFVTMGGQISIMVTECAQGMFSCIAFLVIVAAVLMQFHWNSIIAALNTAPLNASMIHPFHTSAVKDFNAWYFLIGAFGTFYGYLSWQGASGFNSSARTPHEQKMGGIITVWRDMPKILLAIVLPIAAFAVMNLPEYSKTAALVNETIKHIPNEAIKTQMRVPIVLAHVLPVGIKGLFATVMLFFSFTCHDTYMHSWGSIFIQDVVLPIRNKPLSPEQHIKWLRYSIFGVAIFAFLFSFYFPQTKKIFMFFAATATIWLGGSGAVIIGGLYWKKGTTPAAYTALIVGSVLGVGGIVLTTLYKARTGNDFPLNDQVLYMIAMACAIIAYITISMITCKDREYNLDRMLHRGQYSKDVEPIPTHKEPKNFWLKLCGITHEFSRMDRVLAIALVVWNLAWIAFFVVVTIMNLVKPFGNVWWGEFWHVYIWLYIVISIPTTVWFTIGGMHDIKALFRTLDSSDRDESDDGRVLSEPEEVFERKTESTPELHR